MIGSRRALTIGGRELGDAPLALDSASIAPAGPMSAPPGDRVPLYRPGVQGFFQRVGEQLAQPDVRAALLRSGAATMSGGIPMGIGAAAAYMDQQRARRDDQQRYDQQFQLQHQRVAQQNADAARQAAEGRSDSLSRAASGLRGVPQDQRASALGYYRAAAVARGEDPAYLDQLDLSDGGLEAHVNLGRRVDQNVDAQRPQIVTTQPGGSAVEVLPYGRGFRSLDAPPTESRPSAPTTEAEYRALPPGAEYTGPDGRRRRKGGAPSQGGATFP